MPVKNILPILVIIISFSSFAQNRFIAGASFNIGFPSGSFADIATTGIGGSIIGEYAFNEKISSTLSVGYQNFTGEIPVIAVQGVMVDIFVNSIPVLAGIKYFFSKDFFGTLEAGAHFVKVNAHVSDLYDEEIYSTDYEAKFGGGIGAGYRNNLSDQSVFELSALYQVVEDDYNSFALRFGILILLDKL